MARGDTHWQDRVNSIWYGRSPLRFLLLPLSALFSLLAAFRRALYRAGVLGSYKARVPVIVVGNISAGGTGKTPTATSGRRVSAQSYQVDYTGEFVLHCHNLFHEDNGMMLSVAITA